MIRNLVALVVYGTESRRLTNIGTKGTAVLNWALATGVQVLPMFADSFRGNLRSRWSNRRLSKLLNHPDLRWAGNHNVNAARSLECIGVAPHKIIPGTG